MLNPFLFPFLRPRPQPEPQAETSAVPETDQGAETNDPRDSLADPAHADQPEPLKRRSETSGKSRARKPAGQAGADKAVASRRRTKRPKGAEARSEAELGRRNRRRRSSATGARSGDWTCIAQSAAAITGREMGLGRARPHGLSFLPPGWPALEAAPAPLVLVSSGEPQWMGSRRLPRRSVDTLS